MIDRIIRTLHERRENVLSGEINCIPFNLPKFRQNLPGIEKSKYYLVSGATKSGKSQITNYLFLYTPILYAYHNPDKARVKIFYFPLEETPENITLRFMSYLLYVYDKIRIAPIDLKSTNSEKVLDPKVLELLESDKYQSILKFYEEHVIFLTDRNPTGVWKQMVRYAEATGDHITKKVSITNHKTGVVEEKEVFDYYKPKDDKEYVILIVDHVSLIDTERGFDLRESINKLSEYMMILRNKYGYIPVLVHQQGNETTNLEAFKSNKIRPTMAGLSDSKYTSKDCSVMLGITNPFSHELPQYLGYDITRLKGNIRLLEIVLNREGESNGIVPLYFDGACNYFCELPSSKNEVEMAKVYKLVEERKERNAKSFFIMLGNKINRKKWQMLSLS